jgi:prephenate dehydrogenase
MTIQLTVIGLGKIGVSLGLALKDHKDKILRVGHDRNQSKHSRVKEIDAFDQTPAKINAAVEDADIIIFDLPIDEIKDTIEIIAPLLKPGAVVMDTSPLKIGVLRFIEQFLPEDRYFVTFHPTINPDFLHEVSNDLEFARQDLFKNSHIVITNSTSTDGDAVKLAADLAKYLGANPFFADPYEIDGLVASSVYLPKLVSAAYIHSLIEQPGWREARKIAGTAFYSLTENVKYLDEREILGSGALLNKENTIRTINDLMYSLKDLRELISNDDKVGLQKWLKHALDERETWEMDRKRANWDNFEDYSDVPSSGDFIKQMLGFGKKRKKLDSK